MEMSKTKNAGRYIVANTTAIMLTVLLGIVSFIGSLGGDGLALIGSVFFPVLLLVLLISFFKATDDFSKLAFRVPFFLFLLNSAALAFNENHVHFYLFACILIFGISCLYMNFPKTLACALLQIVTIATLYLLGIPVVVYGLSPIGALGIFLIFIFSYLFLLMITKSTTTSLNQATIDVNSFKTYLAATQNYLAMLDRSNRIVYVSKPMSDLARSENPELTKGRPFVDLFPSRELKFFAYKMLGHRELYEEDWEFVLDNQKRYFRAVSNAMLEGGVLRGTLITLLDLTHLAERDEVVAMKDNLKIGLFFMNREHVIQGNYSRFLKEVLSETNLKGKRFTELLAASLAPNELNAVEDYFDMVFDRTFDAQTLHDINPLSELCYVSPLGARKMFNCEFVTVEMGKGETVILATIYDITANVQLRERLQREEKKRQEEMSNLFELLQVNPSTFESFQEDMEDEFGRIDKTLSNSSLSKHEILVEVYQAIHAIKSNAVTLGLNSFGSKVHELESKIKTLRNLEEDVPFDDMLHLTIEIEKLAQEKDDFKEILNQISSFKIEGETLAKSSETIFLESLSKAADKVAADMEKKVRFVAADIDRDALTNGPRRLMKEVLMQLVRNSVAHGLEPPGERVSKGKNEMGIIRLSIKRADNNIHIKLADDGRGFDFDKIRERAISLNLIDKEEANNSNKLINAIFASGFSTAEDEGIHAGRGIGLSLVKDWVYNARGTIKLQTEAGKGTVFNIFFPAGNDETKDKES